MGLGQCSSSIIKQTKYVDTFCYLTPHVCTLCIFIIVFRGLRRGRCCISKVLNSLFRSREVACQTLSDCYCVSECSSYSILKESDRATYSSKTSSPTVLCNILKRYPMFLDRILHESVILPFSNAGARVVREEM
jgi:hypothetical protein